MTNATFEHQLAIQAKVEAWTTSSHWKPGPYVYWALATNLRPTDEILFADLEIDVDATEYDSRAGTIFVVTGKAVLLATYAGAIEEPTGNPDEDFGRVTIAVHPWTTASRPSITWAGRALKLYAPSAYHGERVAPLTAGALECVGAGWKIKLPGSKIWDGDAYFSELREAFDLIGAAEDPSQT